MAVDLSFLRVLVVDDEAAITKLVRMLLADFDVTRVTVAKSGSEAKTFLEFRADEIDVVICDWNMPDLTGLDLLKWVRGTGSRMPFIFLTSRSDLESVRIARDHGVSDYLLKPFKSGQLRQKLILQARNLLTI